MRISFSEIQIYLIIGFVFAEGNGRAGRKHSFYYEWLCQCGLSASPDRSYPGSRQVQDNKRSRRGGSQRRWLIINASQRLPDIIFTFLLSRSPAAGGKNKKTLQPRYGEPSGRAAQRTAPVGGTHCKTTMLPSDFGLVSVTNISVRLK